MIKKTKSKTKKEVVSTGYVMDAKTAKLFKIRKLRFQKMLDKKVKLGIDAMCDRFDALFTPHLTVNSNNAEVTVTLSKSLSSDKIFSDNVRKSVPLAFEKITTAMALLIKENPKGVMRSATKSFQQNAPIVEHAYYENFAIMQKKEVLKKYTYELAKYGIAYWREYIKRTYRKQHVEQADGSDKAVWVFDVNDVVAENLHPKAVILDDTCYGVKDVNKPARDLIIVQYLTKDEFEERYPEDMYENAVYVQQGGSYMLPEHSEDADKKDGEKVKIQVLIYENKFENLVEEWANCIPMKSVPLPGDKLSVSGDKWIIDKNDYAGIGLSHIIEMYQPLADDIINASMERLRQIVRPNEDWFNGIELKDEADDISYGSGSTRKFEGSPNDVVYTHPPVRSAAEAQEKEELMEELDRTSAIPRNLAGGADTAKTAYQAALQKESALKKLSLPLESIKKVIEDCANLDIALYKILYSEPEKSIVVSVGDKEFEEAFEIYSMAQKGGYEDDRVVPIANDENNQPNQFVRRQFKTFELPLSAEIAPDGANTGRVIEGDEKNFWEMIPKHFNWDGRMEIIAESFMPTSKAIDDEQKKETIDYLMAVQVYNDMGQPALFDASGAPFMIDKVKLLKERAAMNKDIDPEKIIVPLNNAAPANPIAPNPLDSKVKITPTSMMGKGTPELGMVK